jgi:hypothetical protein
MNWLLRIGPLEANTRKGVLKKGDLLDRETQDVRVAEAVTSRNGSAHLR